MATKYRNNKFQDNPSASLRNFRQRLAGEKHHAAVAESRSLPLFAGASQASLATVRRRDRQECFSINRRKTRCLLHAKILSDVPRAQRTLEKCAIFSLT